jgi:hypothetical protein
MGSGGVLRAAFAQHVGEHLQQAVGERLDVHAGAQLLGAGRGRGVEAGDVVVTEGSDRLADGVSVQVARGAPGSSSGVGDAQ